MTELSVVMPVFNEAQHLPATIDALLAAVGGSGFEAELVLVDDGSTDGSAEVAEDAVAGQLPLRIVSQANNGRFNARRAGIETASSELVLLLDARVRLHPDALAFVRRRTVFGEPVWNGHVEMHTQGNPYGAFAKVLVELAWARYLKAPRTTSFGLDDFDHFPKGTGCFLAPRSMLRDAIAAFRPRISDIRLVSDDTQLIRWIAARERIHLSPAFACDYVPRSDLRSFVRNAIYRGSTFLDGHGRRESRFFPAVAAFYPISALLAVISLRRPGVIPALAVGTAGVAGAVATRARRPPFEVASFATLTPVYAVAHGFGMWHGLLLVLRAKVRSRRSPESRVEPHSQPKQRV